MARRYFRLGNRTKWLLVVVWWLCGMLLAVFWNMDNSRFVAQIPHYTNRLLEYTHKNNHMGAMDYLRRDPDRNGRPLYSIKFDEVNTVNGQMGIFKTGIYKIAKIKKLQLKLFQYSPDNNTDDQNNRSCKVSTDSRNDCAGEMLLTDLLGRLRSLAQDYSFIIPANYLDACATNEKITVHSIDLSDTAEVHVKNFDYQVFHDGQFSFGVQAKRAMASHRQPSVILRGHVTITAPDGGTIECNYAKWNIEKEQFKINGIYVLKRGGKIVSGKHICVDAQLNPVQGRHAKSRQKEAEKCFTKLL